jgi:hypothetical protein
MRSGHATFVWLTLCITGVAALAQEPTKPKTPEASPPANANAGDNGKCIGVLSAIGDSFSLQKIGITAFGNERNKVPIDSWQIDDLVVRKIGAFLGKSWSVRPINYAKGAFASSSRTMGFSTTTTPSSPGSSAA